MKDPYALGFEIVNKEDKPGQLVGIFIPSQPPSPTKFFMPAYPLSAIKQEAFKWFDVGNTLSRCPYISDAKNYPEKLKRVQWLSEGSLGYHMNKFASTKSTCDPWELELFRRFIESGPELKTSWKPWCVQHNEGWCVMRCQHGQRDDSAMHAETYCKHFVTLPFGYERRKPTCPDCLGLPKP